MSPELIVINGPLAGNRHPIGQGEFIIGRAPSAKVVLTEQDVGWRHCQISMQGSRFLITDLRTANGTYVNGMRSNERWLEDRDQIGVGRTILMFRSSEGVPETVPATAEATKPVLLTACSLVFLFRALLAREEEDQVTRGQIVRLVGDLIPISEGFLLLGGSSVELLDRYKRENARKSDDVVNAISRVCEEGAFEDAGSGVVGVPLYLSAALCGCLIVRVLQPETTQLLSQLETLTAVASLAGVGFEANREVERLRAENQYLQQQIAVKVNTGIVGDSAAVRRLLERVERVAKHDTTVLVTGESGTGKELVARALHQKSSRRDRTFIPVNCAALSETLFESELFGHEKGAFTNAIALKRGLFELADGGTIFLDEVGELALKSQAKLLRVLQEREFVRVGGIHVHPLDIRVIAATNRDLSKEVAEGRFREDLFHRINVVELQSPPLRERKEDIPLLANYFLDHMAQKSKRPMKGLTPEALELVMQYNWGGNVRELENAMERAVVLGDSDWVQPEDLPEAVLDATPRELDTKYQSSVEQARREAILDAYRQSNGDYKGAAKLLGLHPNYLLRLVRNLQLRDDINRLKDDK